MESSKWLKLIGQHETWVVTEEKAQGDLLSNCCICFVKVNGVAQFFL